MPVGEGVTLVIGGIVMGSGVAQPERTAGRPSIQKTAFFTRDFSELARSTAGTFLTLTRKDTLPERIAQLQICAMRAVVRRGGGSSSGDASRATATGTGGWPLRGRR